LRETLIKFSQDRELKKKIVLKQYKNGLGDLIKNLKPARTYKFYSELADIAFDFIENYQSKASRLDQ